MVWVYIALAILLLFLVALYLLKFNFSLEVHTPASLQGAVGISFLGFRREARVDAIRVLSGWNDKDEDEESWDMEGTDQADGNTPSAGPQGNQRGALRVPDSWIGFAARFRRRLRQALIKWGLDWAVWRALIQFTLRSGRRVLGLLRPALRSLRIGMEDVYDLGRIAAAWSVISGTIAALNCPLEYGFAEKPFSLKAKVAGGFTGLGALGFGLMTVFTFPWTALGKRFLHCWRNPRLNRWQRRVLLP